MPDGFSPIEELDDRVRKARELTKHFNNLAATKRDNFLDRYAKADINVAIRRASVGQRHRGFVFKAIPGRPFDSGTNPPSDDRVNTNTSREWQYGQKASMLSRNVQLVKGEQKVIPSFVWRETFDDSLIGSRKPLYLFLAPASPRV